MHRNGIQLSGTTARVMSKDVRPIVRSLGIEVIEIPSLHDRRELFGPTRAPMRWRANGKPSLIYPVGYPKASVARLRDALRHSRTKPSTSARSTRWRSIRAVQVPGSLMSYRDPHAMLECLFYVNELPGGEAHHDGGMKGRDHAAALANPMLQLSAGRDRPRSIGCAAAEAHRRADGAAEEGIAEPGARRRRSSPASRCPAPTSRSARAPDRKRPMSRSRRSIASQCFFVSCDLNPSTKLGKAAALRAARTRVRDEHPGAGRHA